MESHDSRIKLMSKGTAIISLGEYLMNLDISIGTTNSFEKVAEPRESAAAMASGAMDVFSTPSLVALFEQTALLTVDPHLPEGFGTVGIEVSVRHLKATAIGSKVRCTVEVTAVDGKRISFKGEMWDEVGRIGDGTHTRYVINKAEFVTKLHSPS
jgi:predicted thioesterase